MVYMYKLYHVVEVSTRFAHRRPQIAQRPILSDITNLYHGLCGPDNASMATVSAIKGLSAYLATIHTIAAEHCQLSPILDIDDRKPTMFSIKLASSLIFRTTVLSSLCRKGRLHSCCADFNLKKSATAAVLSNADQAFTGIFVSNLETTLLILSTCTIGVIKVLVLCSVCVSCQLLHTLFLIFYVVLLKMLCSRFLASYMYAVHHCFLTTSLMDKRQQQIFRARQTAQLTHRLSQQTSN